MFRQGRYHETRLILCVVLAFILLSVDRSNEYTNRLKGYVSVIFTPMYYIANAPTDFASNFYNYIENSAVLIDENQQLKYEKLQLEGMLQKFTSLKQENQRLRELLKSSEKVSDKLLVAELLHVSTEPGMQQFVLNQGLNKSVFVGQAVIDSNGVVGQIMSVNHFTSRVLLITDLEHAIPIEVLRNNYRAIAVGVGDRQNLELINVPNTVDIIVGDLLVSSGLGRRFPSGYPVGKVISIDKNPSLPFAKIIVEPIAKLNQIREVLLIWPGNKVSANTETDGALEQISSLDASNAPINAVSPESLASSANFAANAANSTKNASTVNPITSTTNPADAASPATNPVNVTEGEEQLD